MKPNNVLGLGLLVVIAFIIVIMVLANQNAAKYKYKITAPDHSGYYVNEYIECKDGVNFLAYGDSVRIKDGYTITKQHE